MRADKLPPPVGAGVELAAALSVALLLAVAVAIALLEPPPAAAVCVLVLLDEGCPGVLLGEAVTTAAHTPAVEDVVPPVLQHVHALHPAVCTAEALQQQPARQRFVPQAKFELQGSPGPYVRHEPDW